MSYHLPYVFLSNIGNIGDGGGICQTHQDQELLLAGLTLPWLHGQKVHRFLQCMFASAGLVNYIITRDWPQSVLLAWSEQTVEPLEAGR